MIIKVEYRYYNETYPVKNDQGMEMEEKTRGRTFVEFINPHNIRLDPGGNSFIIEKRQVTLADFESMATANNWLPGPVKRVVAKATAPTLDKDKSQDNYTPIVNLEYVYSKAISNQFGQLLLRDYHYIIANEEEVVHTEKNYRVNGKFPYVVCFPMKTVTSRYGRGYLEKLKPDIIAYLDSLNLIFDKFKLSTLGVYEYNTNAINSEHAGVMSIEPNKWIGMEETGTIKNIFQNSIDPMSLNVHALIERILKSRSGQNEASDGSTVSKRQTAEEVNIKAGQVQGMLLDIANDIETTHFEPMIELIAETELMYMDDELRYDISKSIESKEEYKMLVDRNFNERIEIIRDATIKARGISGKIAKSQAFDKIIKILNVIGNMPAIAAALDSVKLVEKIFESFDDAPDELINMAILQAQANQKEPGENIEEQPQEVPPGVPQAPQGGAGALPPEVAGLLQK